MSSSIMSSKAGGGGRSVSVSEVGGRSSSWVVVGASPLDGYGDSGRCALAV